LKKLSTFVRFGASILALALLATPAAAFQSGSFPPKTQLKVSKEFKKGSNKALKNCKANLKDLAKDTCESIDELRDALGEGFQPGDVADALLIEMAVFHRLALGEVAETHTAIANAASAALSNYFETELPPGFITGECDTTDKLNADIQKELQKTTDKVMKKVKKLKKDMDKKADTGLTASLTPPDPPAVSPDPPQPTKKKLARDSAAGSNDTIEGGSGQLCLGGTYDPAEGAEVSVTLLDALGPGMDLTTTATLDPANCRWKVCFGNGHGADDPLPEGNYAIEIDQLKGVDVHTTSGGTAGVP
jgi:hypothetical protein